MNNIVIFSDTWEGQPLLGYVLLRDETANQWEDILKKNLPLWWWLNDKQCIVYETLEAAQSVLFLRKVPNDVLALVNSIIAQTMGKNTVFPPII